METWCASFPEIAHHAKRFDTLGLLSPPGISRDRCPPPTLLSPTLLPAFTPHVHQKKKKKKKYRKQE
ncbi:unnamed protein product [Arctogadus glacialis]